MNYGLFDIEYAKQKERENSARCCIDRQWYLEETCWNCEAPEKKKTGLAGLSRYFNQIIRKFQAEPAAKKTFQPKLEKARKNSF